MQCRATGAAPHTDDDNTMPNVGMWKRKKQLRICLYSWFLTAEGRISLTDPDIASEQLTETGCQETCNETPFLIDFFL